MKTKLHLVLMFLTIVTYASAQSFKVLKSEQLKLEGSYYQPIFSPDGNKLLLSGEKLEGLSLLDLQSKELQTISNSPGAGFQPVFSDNGSKIYYKSYKLKEDHKRYETLKCFDLETKQDKSIISDQRNLSSPNICKGNVVFSQNTKRSKTINKREKVSTLRPKAPVAINEDLKIALYHKGKKKVLEPVGDYSYIWVSLSPGKDKLLFNAAGKGTFISDLDGNVLVEVGRAHGAKWSSDGKWIVFMDDYDDGEIMISSDIYVMSSDGKQKINLTADSDEILLYPDWSSDMKKIVCQNDNGSVHILHLSNK
jgi:Tol biopolymer transport system component